MVHCFLSPHLTLMLRMHRQIRDTYNPIFFIMPTCMKAPLLSHRISTMCIRIFVKFGYFNLHLCFCKTKLSAKCVSLFLKCVYSVCILCIMMHLLLKYYICVNTEICAKSMQCKYKTWNG